jgi:hypothetical protein
MASTVHPGFDGTHGFDGHHRFDGHHGFEHRRFGFGPVWPYYGYYRRSTYQAPAYWYYCPSYGAYYPNVEKLPGGVGAGAGFIADAPDLKGGIGLRARRGRRGR